MSRVIHFEIHATQPQVLVDFYTQALGWQITKLDWMDYWMIETGAADQPGINGAILERPVCTPTDSTMVNAFVCTVNVENLDETLEKSQALGATIQLPKAPVPGVGWIAYIKDPDGNLLGLMQDDASAA